jgi:hypothetical protein
VSASTTTPKQWVEREAEAYKSGEDRPLLSFATVMAVYSSIVALGSLFVRRRGGFRERIGPEDLVLASVATHKVSRLVAKDPVTSPLRAPFTTFEGTTGPAELDEKVRGTGWRRAVGELLTCPFCLAQWTATAFVFGLSLAPRFTRSIAAIFTTVAAADFLHFAYSAVEQNAEGG